MTLKAQDVFTPGAFPSHTYVARTGEQLESALRDAIDTRGQIVSLVGPSDPGRLYWLRRLSETNCLSQ